MLNNTALKMGCVADDFTGAGDVASFIAKNGARCLLINGVPDATYQPNPSYEAIVIALKSRSCPVDEAVAQVTMAFEWLQAHGATTLYFKYCSTFDSTSEGNIGPVMDRLLEVFNLPYSVLCPALPVNKRTVKDGRLYVNGIPLDESPMRHHPVNPMWNSRISVLMEAQSKYPCHVLTAEMLERSDEDVYSLIDTWKKENSRFYIVTDYYDEKHGRRIASLFKNLLLLSGGSALPEYLFREIGVSAALAGKKALILAGSCSEMTRKQIVRFKQNGGKAFQILPQKLFDGTMIEESIWDFVQANQESDLLVYSSQSPEEIGTVSPERQHRVSFRLESLMGTLSIRALENGYRTLIVAGGETSGAVMQAIGGNAYEIGPSVAPGVPVLYPLEAPGVQLVLKSGNFGNEDFFLDTIHKLEGKNV